MSISVLCYFVLPRHHNLEEISYSYSTTFIWKLLSLVGSGLIIFFKKKKTLTLAIRKMLNTR